jgi:hypothetical protein
VWRLRGSGPERRLHGSRVSGAQLAYGVEVTRRQAGSWRDVCEELGCGERFWATSAAEVEVSGMVRGGGGATPVGCRGCGPGVLSRDQRIRMC